MKKEKWPGRSAKVAKGELFLCLLRFFAAIPSVQFRPSVQSSPVKVRQTNSSRLGGCAIPCKYLAIKGLQNNQLSGGSKSVKVNQTDYEGLIKAILGAKAGHSRGQIIQLNPT
jgi:hypothetical protein